MVIQFKSDCVDGTFRRNYKNFELYLFLLFSHWRSGFLVDGPEKKLSNWGFLSKINIFLSNEDIFLIE